MALSREELDEKARLNGLDTTAMSDKELRKVYKDWTGEDIEPVEKKKAPAKKAAAKKPAKKSVASKVKSAVKKVAKKK